jgi:hypothetical protein
MQFEIRPQVGNHEIHETHTGSGEGRGSRVEGRRGTRGVSSDGRGAGHGEAPRRTEGTAEHADHAEGRQTGRGNHGTHRTHGSSRGGDSAAKKRKMPKSSRDCAPSAPSCGSSLSSVPSSVYSVCSVVPATNPVDTGKQGNLLSANILGIRTGLSGQTALRQLIGWPPEDQRTNG